MNMYTSQLEPPDRKVVVEACRKAYLIKPVQEAVDKLADTVGLHPLEVKVLKEVLIVGEAFLQETTLIPSEHVEVIAPPFLKLPPIFQVRGVATSLARYWWPIHPYDVRGTPRISLPMTQYYQAAEAGKMLETLRYQGDLQKILDNILLPTSVVSLRRMLDASPIPVPL